MNEREELLKFQLNGTKPEEASAEMLEGNKKLKEHLSKTGEYKTVELIPWGGQFWIDKVRA